MTGAEIAFLDASVLYQAAARTLLMFLHLEGGFLPIWSDAVHEEWIAALLANRPDLIRQQLERTKELMNRDAPGASISGYEHLIPMLVLPDANDRHVLAAAIHGNARTIVTHNTRHFPAPLLAAHGLEALHPDAFVMRIFERSPALVLMSARRHKQSLTSPPVPVMRYLGSLETIGLAGTAAALKPYAQLME